LPCFPIRERSHGEEGQHFLPGKVAEEMRVDSWRIGQTAM